jgi:hypothetical protein
MKGTFRPYDKSSNTGFIIGEDGVRYNFSNSDISDKSENITLNTILQVEFDLDGKSAKNVKFDDLSEPTPAEKFASTKPFMSNSSKMDYRSRSSPSEQQSSPTQPPPQSIITKILASPMRLAALVVFVLLNGFWAYTGFISPTLYFSQSEAKGDCIGFAIDKFLNKEVLFTKIRKVRIMDNWIKDGQVVVELGLFEKKFGNQSYTPRLCVHNGKTVRILGIASQDSWRK